MVIVFTFLFGLLCALYWGWLLTLIFLGSVPAMAGVAYLMGASLRPSKDDEAKAYAQSAGACSQALHAIKTVQAFGKEQLEIQRYTNHLEKAKAAQQTRTLKGAVGQGLMFLFMYLLYAGFLFAGGYLRYKHIKNKPLVDLTHWVP